MDETIVQVALLTRLQRIRELVFVEINGDRYSPQVLSSQSQKDRQIHHFGCEDQVRAIGPRSSFAG
jgi:hypothetical protein